MTANGRHVPLAAPGDRIAADGGILPGPHHADPPCAHFPPCGGCELQHVDHASYAEFVTARVAGARPGQGVEPRIDRKCDGSGKVWAVLVDIGGRSYSQKKKQTD